MRSMMPSRQISTRSFLVLDDDERAACRIGHISEFPKVLVDIMQKHRTRIHDLVATLDEDGDGLIDFREFCTVLRAIGFKTITDDDFRKLFRRCCGPHFCADASRAAVSASVILRVLDKQKHSAARTTLQRVTGVAESTGT